MSSALCIALTLLIGAHIAAYYDKIRLAIFLCCACLWFVGASLVTR